MLSLPPLVHWYEFPPNAFIYRRIHFHSLSSHSQFTVCIILFSLPIANLPSPQYFVLSPLHKSAFFSAYNKFSSLDTYLQRYFVLIRLYKITFYLAYNKAVAHSPLTLFLHYIIDITLFLITFSYT